MKHTLTLITAALLLTTPVHAAAKSSKTQYSLTSPDGKTVVEITKGTDTGADIAYAVAHNGNQIVSTSQIGLQFADNTTLGRLIKVKYNRFEETVKPRFYRNGEFVVRYNELTVFFQQGGVTFRAFDEGIAYRFFTDKKTDSLYIANELARINFADDYTVWLPYSTNDEKPTAMAYQNFYDKTTLSKAYDKLAFLPVTVDCGGTKVTVLESDLVSYPGMFVKADNASHALEGVFARYPKTTNYYPWRKQQYVTSTEDYIAKTTGKRTYPWRILAITDNDRQMPVNNLVYALARENKTGDTSWIKPGKSAWEWWNDWNLKGVPFKSGINMPTYKYYIDFAARYGLQYVILDEGWYVPQSGDMLTAVPQLNLQELIDYGKAKGVGVVLWTVFNVLDAQLEEACSKYAAMGVKGFKVDFLDRDDQTAVEMVERIAAACAKHKLMLDLHGIYKPVGLNRTYPNIVNYESVFGMEEMKWSDPVVEMPEYDVTFPFIRMMCGSVDYTPGAMRNAARSDWKPMYSTPYSQGTRCHQLATYIVHDSPFTMLADAPTAYDAEPEVTRFIASIPCDVDETRILQGVIGEHIVTMRRKADSYYIGGMTDWNERDITLTFDFLPAGKQYKAVIMRDGINANKNAHDYIKEEMTVSSTTTLTLHLASGGGFAAAVAQ
ncbi:MAG: glycoside hydrolase family 97 protein [Bacteroidaceae bacterium]|nr:glycoside hydrolase family 97 protein [Bacteroidaceae bacterium]